jgi:hypothetical protein
MLRLSCSIIYGYIYRRWYRTPTHQSTRPSTKLHNNCLKATARFLLTGKHKNQLAKSGTLVEGFQNSPCTFGINVGNFQAEMIIPCPFEQSLSRQDPFSSPRTLEIGEHILQKRQLFALGGPSGQ